MLMRRFSCPFIPALIITCLWQSAHADIKVLKGRVNGPWWQRLDFDFGGSIRAKYQNKMGSVDAGSYKHKIFDDSTRFYFTGAYLLTENARLIAYYEPGVDMAHLLHMSGHYDSEDFLIKTRRRYVGFSDATWGRLTFGKQDMPYYLTVGTKTSKWDHDKLAQGPGVGVDSDYDTTHKSRKNFVYRNDFGPLDLYLSASLPAHGLHLDYGERYYRKGGGAIGLNYHVNDKIEIAAAYAYTRAHLEHLQKKQHLDQQLAGAAISFKDKPWEAALGGGYYWDFVPSIGQTVALQDYFGKRAYGVEAYLAYTFDLEHLNLPLLRKINPYIAADRLATTRGQKYHRNDQFVGIRFYLANNLRLEMERTFTQSKDHLADENRVRLRYDF